jgi:hypothetical protein
MLTLPPRLALFSAAAVIVAVSGTALVWAGPAAPSWSAEGVVAEYRGEAGRLKLAPGWSWPKELVIDAGTREAPMHYQQGVGAGEADFRWLCSWATRATSKTLSPKIRREALEQLATGMRNPAYLRGMDASSLVYPKAAVADAQSGKTRDLREYASSCERNLDRDS